MPCTDCVLIGPLGESSPDKWGRLHSVPESFMSLSEPADELRAPFDYDAAWERLFAELVGQARSDEDDDED